MSELLEPAEREVDPVEQTDVADVETTEEVEAEAATADDDASDEQETEEEASAEDPPKPKPKSRAQRRIDDLTREKYEAQRAAEESQRKLAEYEQFLNQQRMQQQVGQLGQQMPTLEQFNYDAEAYQQGVQSWVQNQFHTLQEQQTQAAEQARQQQAMMQEQQRIQQKVAEGMAKYPDFQQKVMDPSLPSMRQVNEAAYQAMIESDSAVDIAYYLANNPQEVYAFAQMNPVQAIKKMANLEASLGSRPQQPTKRPPKPPSSVSGNSEAVKSPDSMTTEEWMKWRETQIAKKR